MKKILLSAIVGLSALAAQSQVLNDNNSYLQGPSKIDYKGQIRKTLTRDAASGWFDPAVGIRDYQGSGTFFRSTLFPDSTVLINYSDGLGRVGTHSVGFIFDPRSTIFSDKPFQTTRFNTYLVDSIAVLYLYQRHNPDPNTIDTLRITTFLKDDILHYTTLSFGTVPYDKTKNDAKGTTTQTVYYQLKPKDTSSVTWAVVQVPVGRTVNWSNVGYTHIGMAMTYIPGDKTYSKTVPFDTLAADDFPMTVRRHNQFEFQLLQDPTAYTESDPTVTNTGTRIYNNGIWVTTQTRYQLFKGTQASLNDNYYGATWSNATIPSFTQMPRVLFHISTNNLSTAKIDASGNGLGEAYPNPNNGTSELNIPIKLAKAGDVTITISDITGKVVKTFNGSYGQGESNIAISTSGMGLGVYTYTMATANFNATSKFVIE